MTYFWIIELVIVFYTLTISTTYVEQLVKMHRGDIAATSKAVFLGSIFGWTLIITYLIDNFSH